MNVCCYCALWMPTVTYRDFSEPLESETGIVEISDELDNTILNSHNDSKLYVKLHCQPNFDIEILIYKDDGYGYERQDDSLTIWLRHIDHSHNGMFSYAVETEIEQHPLIYNPENQCYRFPSDLYHRIKGFYHSHCYHQEEDGDSMILPFVSTSPIDIKTADNDVIAHYLELYESKFLNDFDFLQYNFVALANSSVATKILFFLGKKRHHSFYKIATRMKGYKTYYNTLYMSCYNTSVRVERPAPDDTEEVKALRRRAFNIENIIRNVDVMEDRIGNLFGLSNARISFWIALLAIVISILTFVYSR